MNSGKTAMSEEDERSAKSYKAPLTGQDIAKQMASKEIVQIKALLAGNLAEQFKKFNREHQQEEKQTK